jgi:hypothetical protein
MEYLLHVIEIALLGYLAWRRKPTASTLAAIAAAGPVIEKCRTSREARIAGIVAKRLAARMSR